MKKAFERLELHDMKVSRAVLRGLEDSNVLWLPDPAQAYLLVFAHVGHSSRPASNYHGFIIVAPFFSLPMYFLDLTGNSGTVALSRTGVAT